MTVNQQWLIARQPRGPLRPSDFTWRESPLEPLGPGMVRTRVLYAWLDPTNRVWFSRGSYLPPLVVGDVMRAVCIGVVEESNNPALQPGTTVTGFMGWQTRSTSDGSDLTVLPELPGLPLTAHFGLLSHIGLAAYHGVVDIGRPQPGQTVVVSAAAGAVGSLAGQIAKIAGARVIGIAGGPEKCRRITEDLGFDAAIDYKGEDVVAALRRLCPDGVDVYFDNVGGAVLDAVLGEINDFGRVVACGMIGEYDESGQGHVFTNLSNLVNRRTTLQGFIVLDHLDLVEVAYPRLLDWHAAGRLQYAVDVVDGLENVPAALGRLFEGTNSGKLIARISTDEGADAR
ncbi:hypothetical protein GCM10027586_06540 [Kineococcus gypseus]|uniref:NADP-dependent oxidoreductase n=1 Tax=Kineococcus gypseus TaxID=1637102 RepID=UPI003D7D4D3F